MNFLTKEVRTFLSCPRDMRILLLTNLVFAFVLPVIELFVAAYIMRNSQAASKVASYQVAIYAGTPLAFLLNGLMLEKLGVKFLYGMGMVCSGGSLVLMMSSPVLTIASIALSGFLMGLASGLFWANRDLLALMTTSDANRNYFYGLETSFNTITAVIVPGLLGWFISTATSRSPFVHTANGAYHAVAISTCVLAIIACVILSAGSFRRSARPKFLFFRFHRAWNHLLMLAVLIGLGQGYLVMAPALLVLMLVGKEGSLGAILAIGGLVSAVVLYVTGRIAQPKHRILVLGMGFVLFVLGSLVNTVLFNAVSVLIFMACLVLAKPALQWAYFPIQMGVIDAVSAVEGRNQYAYVFNHELGLFAGRLIGCTSFLYLAFTVSDIVALRVALPTIAILQLLAVPMARRVQREIMNMHTTNSQAQGYAMEPIPVEGS